MKINECSSTNMQNSRHVSDIDNYGKENESGRKQEYFEKSV